MSATRLKSFLILAALGCLAMNSGAQTPAVVAPEAEAPAAAAEGPEAELRSYFGDYLEAFNKGDAKAIAALWAEDAVWRSDVAGSETIGREAIEASLAEAFGARPGIKLTGHINRLHPIADGVMTIDGVTTTIAPGEDPTNSAFTAVAKKTDQGWRLSDVHEYAPPVALTPHDRLQELSFLVGEWEDDSEGVSVSTSVRWGAGESFLVRSYVVADEEGEPVLQGTQVIGWDPRTEKFRSWSFDSEGSFGDGVWSRSGDEWVGRLTETLPDGELASATQVIRLLNDDTLEVTTLSGEVAGEPQPSSDPIRVQRVAEPEADAPSGE